VNFVGLYCIYIAMHGAKQSCI